jgi:hypothetical protein
MAQDRDLWRTLVTTVMNYWFPLKVRNVLSKLSDYQLLEKDSGPS